MRIGFSILTFVLFVIAGCKDAQRPITKLSDYDKYLHIPTKDSMHSIQRIEADIDFWNLRLKMNPEDAVAKSSLAGLYAARFSAGGDINDIHTSDSLYRIANDLFKTNTSSIYRSLAANYITQHKFRKARLYLDTAATMGDDLYLTLLMQFDVALELGDRYAAEETLNRLKNKNCFDYLIREAKLTDHLGDLDGAIKKMEKAFQKAVDSKKEVLILWAKSNLADMYGHANRYDDAYRAYLDVLERKPDYLHALKGIAWLAFSHDRNLSESKRILSYLSKIHPVPDYDLLLAEIATYEGDGKTEKTLLKKFLAEVSDARYGDMYNKYVFHLIADEGKNSGILLQIGQTEVSNRPTPQSYDLLAWAYYLNGNKEEALRVAKNCVENKNYEPDALYHLGMIYASSGNIKKASRLLREAENAAYELGPLVAQKIQRDLRSIEN